MPSHRITIDILNYDDAIRLGSLKIVKMLHLSGVYPKDVSVFNRAVQYKRYNIVFYMLEHNMLHFDYQFSGEQLEENLKLINGVKPVDVAIDNLDFKMVRLLLSFGLVRDVKSWNYALSKGSKRMLKLLKEVDCPYDDDEDIIDEVAQFGVYL